LDEVKPGYEHDALFYESEEELVASAEPFLRAALDRSEMVVLACADRNASLLADALQGHPRIGIVDRSEVYRRVPAAIAAYQRMAESHLAEGADRVRVVAEIDFDRDDWEEWARFEALSNAVLEPYSLWALCLYDTRRLRPEVLKTAGRTHPRLMTAADRAPNPDYVSPDRFLSEFAAQPDPLEATAPAIDLTGAISLHQLRQEVTALLAAGSSPGPPDMVNGFVFAVSEVATNAMVHGRAPVRVRVWTAADRAVCTVTDHGDGFSDPFTGYQSRGHRNVEIEGQGLWMARQLCDVVGITREPGAFTVRIISFR
jgi:MEDS: MEthanogen/methylotroph, DcmR Sensory domain/Histidine kinase-like ATPase domain